MKLEEAIIVAGVSAVLALVFNSVLQLIKSYFDSDLKKKEFQREQSLNRLNGLYLDVYKTIIQSEYVRYFTNKYGDSRLDPIDFPFIEIGMSKKMFKYINGKLTTEEQEIINDITQEKKNKIIGKILDNPQYSSINLSKIATAYRYVYHYFIQDNLEKEFKRFIDDEEIRLSRMLIMTIIKETNELLEKCNLDIDGKEISYGLFNHDIFEKERL